MKLYLAGISSTRKIGEWVVENFPDIGALCTFATPKQIDKLIEFGFKHIMLDSGAFSVDQSGIKIDIDEFIKYVKKYQKICEEKGIVLEVVGLDVISNGNMSVENWDYMRHKGVDCIPTFHAGEDLSILDYYASEANRISLGGMAGDIVEYKRISKAMASIFSRHPNKKYHILGVNDYRIIQKFPFYSCDALTWRNGSRFGEVITEHGRFKIGRNKNTLDVKKTEITKWLFERGIAYPLPEDFDYRILDILNIRTLYKQLVLFHNENLVNEVIHFSSLY